MYIYYLYYRSFLENVFKRLEHLCGFLQRFDHNTIIVILHVVLKYGRSPQVVLYKTYIILP